MPEPSTKTPNYLKATFTLLMAIYGFYCARSSDDGSFLDRVNLIAHEAGHLLFGYFGEFLMVIGGTIGQLLVPAGIAIYFFSRRELFSATVALFWIGQNFLQISVYVKDAALMELPLVSIGGGDVMHDWNYLLLKFNLLAHDQTIGSAIFWFGVLIMIIAVIAGFYCSFKNCENG